MRQKKYETSHGSSYRRVEIISSTAKMRQGRRRLKINWRPVKISFYVVFILAVVYFLGFSNFFKIKNIEMDGIKSIEVSDYLHQSLVGKNILFFMPGQYLPDLVSKFPILEQVKIVRGLPSTVRIIASEKVQVLTWCANGCFNIDNYGYAYETALPSSGKIVLTDKSGIDVKMGDKITSPEFIGFYLKTLERLKQMGIVIKDSRIEETSFKLIFKTQDGYDIIFDTSESMQNQLDALRQVKEKNRADIKEYVDLRVEGLAYIK